MSDESVKSNQTVPEGFDSWNAYWTGQGMPWRTEPEIDAERQRYLTERRAVTPDIERGIYPFRDAHGGIKLNRADVEWLLATHAEARWPFLWGRVTPGLQKQGVDLRGANLGGVDLRRLPLMQLRAGLDAGEWTSASGVERDAASVHLEGANLNLANLQDASLRGAHLEGANLESAHLEGTVLRGASFGGVIVSNGRNQQDDDLRLSGASLRFAYMDFETNLRDINLGEKALGFALLADIHWNNVDVTTVPWNRLPMMGDEQQACMRTAKGKRKSNKKRMDEYMVATRGYRQLATVLRAQGIVEEADRFAYRAQVLQRVVQRRQHRYLRYIGSLLLDLVAGYGYRPGRSILIYFAVILWFANFYVWASHGLFSLGLPPSHVQSLAWYEGLILSVSSFHGRGFQPFQNLNDPIAALAGIQAVFGLIIEVSFIATFTQRFFAR